MGLSVNAANGNLIVDTQGANRPGVNGMGEDVSPVYNNLSTVSGPMGRGWTSGTGADTPLQFLSDGSVGWFDPTGGEFVFAQNGGTTFLSPPGIDSTLVKNGDGTYTLTGNFSGTKWTYSSAGNLTSIQNRQGNSIAFTYNGTGLPNVIANTEGQTTSFTYTNGRITQVTQTLADSTTRTWIYSYDPTNTYLTSITDPRCAADSSCVNNAATYCPQGGSYAACHSTQFAYTPNSYDGVNDLMQKNPIDSFDLSKTAQLMQGKGYAKDSQGFWAKGGKRFSLVLSLPPPFFTDIAPVIVEQFRIGGFDASFKSPTNWSTLVAQGDYPEPVGPDPTNLSWCHRRR